METISRALFTFCLNSLWQIPLAAGVAALICRTMRRAPAMHRHAVWVVTLVIAALLPLVSVVRLPAAQNAELTLSPGLTGSSQNAPLQHSSRAAAPSIGVSAMYRTLAFATSALHALASAYLLFVLYRLLRLARAAGRTLQIRRTAYAANLPPLLRGAWERSREAFGIPEVGLLFSTRISGPVAAGNVIVLPECLLSESSEDVLTSAIGHEMAHVARRDFACNIGYELLHLPIAFHPAAWWIRSRIERTREMACDELVSQRLIAARIYAESIVRIAAAMTALPQPGYTLGAFDGDVLEERIRRLMQHPAASSKRARALLAAGISALAVLAVFASGFAVMARAQNGAKVSFSLVETGEAEIHVSEVEVVTHLIHRVDPVYPEIAKRVRIEGKLVYEIIIDQDGTVSNIHAVSGNPMLFVAGIDAIRQWRFRPWLINGQPVEVATEVTIPFRLPARQ